MKSIQRKPVCNVPDYENVEVAKRTLMLSLYYNERPNDIRLIMRVAY